MQTRTHSWSLWALVVLFAGIAGWLWYADRDMTTLTITGEATVKAAPDQYVFSPTYRAEDDDKSAAKAKATEQGNAVVAGLKALGLTDAMLATNVSVDEDYEQRYIPNADGSNATSNGFVGRYSITATVTDVTMARAVQEYLGTTPLIGIATPTSSFTAETRKRLERDARKLALEDAKLQADDTAESMGLVIRGLESIGQPSWGGPVFTTGIAEDRAIGAAAPEAELESPELLVGEQEITYQIEVVYRVK